MARLTSLLSKGQFDRIAKALADPRRFALLEAIASDEEYPCQRLCRDFPVTKATISHHLKELVRAGLVQAEREGQYMNYRVRRDVVAAYGAELLARTTLRRSQRIVEQPRE
jgi:ArsR family transcriptional regulator, arsenate/arsenite/antimonite-responsive transcriptional repressor